ncbi:MAG: alpha/beta fold hydrolase [Rhodobacteraceae bacterium]|nr:alpha/beta fold hydrolase [Paracoccaceae bacterium]
MRDPLVLLPAILCDARLFLAQIAMFSDQRPVIFAPLAEGETIEEMAKALLENLPPTFALAGIGMGGVVAMEILRRAPDRVTRIALMDTNAQAEMPNVAAERELLIAKARAGNLADAIGTEMKASFLAQGPHKAEIHQLVMDMGMRLGAETFVRHSRAMMRRPDQQKTLRTARAPALVLCGEEDPVCPVRRHEFIQTLMPAATLRVIPGAGHLPPLEQPEAVNQAFREWLDAPMILN